MRRARASLFAIVCALPLSFLGVVLLDLGVESGELVLIFMPFVTGAVVSRRFYGVDALIWTIIAGAFSAVAAVSLFFGHRHLYGLTYLFLPMFSAAVIGVFLGIMIRPLMKRWFGS